MGNITEILPPVTWCPEPQFFISARDLFKSQGRQVHGRSNVNKYSNDQRVQVIGRGRLVTSELRHQTAGQNDNNAKRQTMCDEVKMSWSK